VIQHVAVCCSVLQCAAVCCSVLQGVAVCGSVHFKLWGSLEGSPSHSLIISTWTVRYLVLVCCYSVLQSVAVYCRLLHSVAWCRSVLQCAYNFNSDCEVCSVVYCNVLQCVAVCCSVLSTRIARYQA